MIDAKAVEKLAKLSRINISEDDKSTLIKDLESILVYVSTVQNVVAKDVGNSVGVLRNVMREDENPHMEGEFTNDIIKEAPSTENNYIKVKKIL